MTRYVDLLAREGLTLGHPYASALAGSRFAFRELRVKAGRKTIPCFTRSTQTETRCFCLVGDKRSQKRFYEAAIPRAESIWETYLLERKTRRGRH